MTYEIKIGKHIIVSLNLEPYICKVGDKGTIIDLWYASPNQPRSWDILLDNGRRLYMYEDEFTLDEQGIPRKVHLKPLGVDSMASEQIKNRGK